MKKLLPPVLFVIVVGLMAATQLGFEQGFYIIFPLNLFGALMMIIGLGIASWHSNLFQKMGTNIMTFDEPDVLVKNGLFRYSRNPMYLGFVIATFGCAVLLQGGIISFILALVFALITDRWYIRFEEREMTKKFGDDYIDYCKEVRRWV